MEFLIRIMRFRNHNCKTCLHPLQESCVLNCNLTGKLVKVETVLRKLGDFHCRLQVMIVHKLLVWHKITLLLTHITVNYFLWRFENFTMTRYYNISEVKFVQIFSLIWNY